LTSISFPSQDSGTLTAVMAVLFEWNGTDQEERRSVLFGGAWTGANSGDVAPHLLNVAPNRRPIEAS